MGILSDTQATAPQATSDSGGGLIGGVFNAVTGGAMGHVMNALFAGSEDNRQYNQQQRLQGLQIQGAEQLADYNQSEQMKTWLATNYPEQVQQMEQAGLNPALLYSSGGGGGGTVASSGGGMPTGATAADAASRQKAGNDTAGMGLMLAQQGLIQAQTKAAEATADNQESQADLNRNHQPGAIDANANQANASAASLTQGINNQKANEALTQVQTDIANIQKQVQQQSAIDQINTIANGAVKAVADARTAMAQANVAEATQQTKINQIRADLGSTLLQQQAIKAGINLTQEQTIGIINKIQQDWQSLQIQGIKNNQDTNAKYNQLTQQAEQYTQDIGLQLTKDIINTMTGIAIGTQDKRNTGTKTITEHPDGGITTSDTYKY